MGTWQTVQIALAQGDSGILYARARELRQTGKLSNELAANVIEGETKLFETLGLLKNKTGGSGKKKKKK